MPNTKVIVLKTNPTTILDDFNKFLLQPKVLCSIENLGKFNRFIKKKGKMDLFT